MLKNAHANSYCVTLVTTFHVFHVAELFSPHIFMDLFFGAVHDFVVPLLVLYPLAVRGVA